MSRRGKNLCGNLKLLHPRNLAKEVHVYGYHFSFKTHILLMFGTLVGISTVGLIFQLSVTYFAIVVIAALVLLPVLVLDAYKKMYEQKRFADVAAYMEQMLYAFLKTGKVISALKESLELFEDGQMKMMIEKSIFHLEKGEAKTEQGILKESLQIIENSYRCVKIRVVHELLVNAEAYGGDVRTPIMLILEDLELWKRRGYRLQADKKKSHADNIISIVVATLMCAAALYVLDGMKGMFAAESALVIFRIGAIQVSSILFILFLYHVMAKSSKSLTADWLSEDRIHEKSYIVRSYEKVIHYDEEKEKRRSVIWASPFFLLGAVLLFFHVFWGGIFSLLIASFLFVQHKVGYHLAKKDITNEMYLALPQWMMEMALLLQNNNVQVAIMKSREGASAALSGELEGLIERIEKMPGKLQTYTDFCKDFDLPEIQSCMKMLHAVSENGTGDIKVQMNHLLQRVNEMQRMADDIQNESIAFRMKLMFSYPVVAATGKLLVDLTMGMAVMFQFLGNMGGM